MKTQYEKDMEDVLADGFNLLYVKNQTPEIVMAAISNNGCALKYVKEQSPEIVLQAVSQNGWALEYVINQTPEICLVAVSESGMALEFVKNQTVAIAMAAVSQDGYAIQHIKVQSPEIALAAVTQNGRTLQFVKKQTPEIALAAVSEEGSALVYVKYKNKTPKILLTAVSQNGMTLKNVENQTKEIALAAVTQNGYAMRYVKEMNQEVILAAWSQVGNDLLNYSARCNNIDAINILLEKNLPVDNVSKDNPLTPFQYAAKSYDKNALLILSNGGANIHIKSKNEHRNVLSEIIKDFNDYWADEAIATICVLLEIGVRPTDKDIHGDTAITLAKDKPEILSVLKAFELKKIIKSTLSKTHQTVNSTGKSF
jgi:phosphosulfolactate phosphohydrolase-like enzyme